MHSEQGLGCQPSQHGLCIANSEHCNNAQAILERTDEQLLPAVYNFVAAAFDASPEQLGYLTLSRALVQAAASPLGGFLGQLPSLTPSNAARNGHCQAPTASTCRGAQRWHLADGLCWLTASLLSNACSATCRQRCRRPELVRTRCAGHYYSRAVVICIGCCLWGTMTAGFSFCNSVHQGIFFWGVNGVRCMCKDCKDLNGAAVLCSTRGMQEDMLL